MVLALPSCHGPLAREMSRLHCATCARQHPAIAGMEPTDYLRSELGLLKRTSRDARQRRDLIDFAPPSITPAHIRAHFRITEGNASCPSAAIGRTSPDPPMAGTEPHIAR